MREEIIEKTDMFLRPQLMKIASYSGKNLRMAEYRIEHSYRVAHIAATIARVEGFDEERAFVAGLLHDIGYSIDFKTKEDWEDHGRTGAKIVRPFLTELGYSDEEVNEMCYGIAIHNDNHADFEGERTPLALTIGDADNIDRYDSFRLYEGLQYVNFKDMSLIDQGDRVNVVLSKLKKYYNMPCGTPTATRMWKDKIGFQIDFYTRLKNQIEHSFF